MTVYKTKLREWHNALEEELDRTVQWKEVSKRTGLAESTFWKHLDHTFSRPDFGTASKICDFFRSKSKTLRRVTPLDYFEEVDRFKLA